MLEPSSKPIPDTTSKAGWPETNPTTAETLEAAYALLKDELKVEEDRSKVVEAKLQGILSLVPLAMTIVFAVVTYLIGGKTGGVSAKILKVEIVGAFYLALQILRALLAVISGLSSRNYAYLQIEDVIPKQGETKEAYLNRTCKDVFDIICLNREVTNGKLNQLNLGHTAIRNAVWGLFTVIGVMLVLAAFGN